jgi:hypothetical protein
LGIFLCPIEVLFNFLYKKKYFYFFQKNQSNEEALNRYGYSYFYILYVFGQLDTKPVKARLLMEFGAEWGGNELITVQFTNGNEQTMNAGQGIYLTAGTELAFTKIEPFLIRMSFGIKWAPTAADDANIAFTRLPLSISPFWKIKEDFRVGVGATAHLSPKFNGDGFVDDIKFPSSIGLRFEIGYKFISLTYTLMNYELSSDKINGNSIGVIFSTNFARKG